jgi:signal transduction histidine kinase
MGVLVGLVIGGSWTMGRLRYRAAFAALIAEQLRDERVERTLHEQRLALARDLHDIVSHAVSAMLLQAAGGQKLVPEGYERLRHALQLIETSGVQAMNELHRMLGLLRNGDQDQPDRARQPSLDDIPALITAFRSSGLDITLRTEGRPGDVDTSVEVAAYRVVQESLTNVAKHAGEGARAEILLHWGGERLVVTVANREGARGQRSRLAGISAGLGIRGLSERVTLLGGRMKAEPTDVGFLVRAELPLSRPARTPLDLGDEIT